MRWEQGQSRRKSKFRSCDLLDTSYVFEPNSGIWKFGLFMGSDVAINESVVMLGWKVALLSLGLSGRVKVQRMLPSVISSSLQQCVFPS